jgi:DNA-binding IclR family transcriptional regulator
MKESERHVDTLLKALQILDCFELHQTLSLNQLSELTNLNKSRILRFCGTLEANRYLVRGEENGLYGLGPRLLSLGKAYEQRNTLISLSRPVLKELAGKTGESASLHILDGDQRLCLAREEGTFGVRHLIAEGAHLPLHAGAGSKVLLAYAPEDFRRQFLVKENLRKMTPTTITDRRIFEKELKRIRRVGYALSAGERDPDAGALAAPVYNHEKSVCATIAIAGPLNRFSKSQDQYLPFLLDAARCLSIALGCENGWKNTGMTERESL